MKYTKKVGTKLKKFLKKYLEEKLKDEDFVIRMIALECKKNMENEYFAFKTINLLKKDKYKNFYSSLKILVDSVNHLEKEL